MAADPVTGDELVRLIETARGQVGTNSTAITNVVRRRSAYESSFRLEEVTVEHQDGTTLQLVLKDVSHASRSDEARLAKSRVSHEPLRELCMYDRVLGPANLGPKVYGMVADASRDRFWLLLEKVDGIELYQIGDLRVWQTCARWLARFHAQFAGQTEYFSDSIPLLQHNTTQAQSDITHLMESEDAKVRNLARELEPTYHRVLEVVYSLPQTLLHGDFYPSNILVCDKGIGPEVIPVDWELAGVGPNLLDLAALTSGRWSARERQAIASSYHMTWSEEHGREQSLSSFLVALDCARLVLALRWLTAPSTWRPPEDHAQMWYADACEMARSLGVLPGGIRARS